MKRRLLDILACPICKHHPLDLKAFRESGEVIEGVLVCSSCKRWYPIIDDIPHMLPDDMRKPDEDLKFLERWKDKIPVEVLEMGKPFNLALKK